MEDNGPENSGASEAEDDFFLVAARKKVGAFLGKASTTTISILILLPPAAIGVALAVLLVRESADVDRLALTWFTVSYAMLVSTVGLFAIVLRKVDSTRDRVVDDVDERLETLSKTLDDRMSPYIRTLNSKDAVCTEATKMLDMVLDRERDALKVSHEVVYFGAANLQPSPEQEEERAEDTDTPKSATMEFKKTLTRVMQGEMTQGERTVLIRYIRLFEPAEFKARSETFQTDHLKWMHNQYELIRTYDSYRFHIAARAPEWGASVSILVAANTVLLILAMGDGGILIRGSEVASELVHETREYMRRAKIKENRPDMFDKRRESEKGELSKLLRKKYGDLWDG